MPATITFEHEATVGSPSVGSFALGTTSASALDGSVPDSIPSSQRYFWSNLWQAGEAESQADIDAGRTQRFTDPLDAVRWLLSEDE